MKHPILIIAAGAFCVLGLASCSTGPTGMQPQTNVEAVERDAPVTGTPNVGQHQAGRNATRYSNGHYGYFGGPGIFGY